MTATSPKNSVLVAMAATVMALAPAAALLLVSPAASAQAPARSVAIEVRLGDLPAGAFAQVGDRIEAAARSACAAVATRSPLLPREQAECVRASIEAAMTRLSDQRPPTILAQAD